MPPRALQLQAQRRGRRLGGKPRRTEAERPAAALARRHLQTPQAIGRQGAAKQAIKPEQGGRHATAAQRLDTGPQGIARSARKHQAQAIEPDSGGGPGRCMGAMGWRDQHHGLTGGSERRQRGQQQPELADAFAFRQQFGELATRPAAAGQFGIEPAKTAGKSRRWRHGEGIATADVGTLQDLGQ